MNAVNQMLQRLYLTVKTAIPNKRQGRDVRPESRIEIILQAMEIRQKKISGKETGKRKKTGKKKKTGKLN